MSPGRVFDKPAGQAYAGHVRARVGSSGADNGIAPQQHGRPRGGRPGFSLRENLVKKQIEEVFLLSFESEALEIDVIEAGSVGIVMTRGYGDSHLVIPNKESLADLLPKLAILFIGSKFMKHR